MPEELYDKVARVDKMGLVFDNNPWVSKKGGHGLIFSEQKKKNEVYDRIRRKYGDDIII